jgi:leucine-rich PPR motif-containing protein
MRADGVSPDLVTYNTLIDACIDAQAPGEAWSVLREISESGLKPDVVTYTTLLKYFVLVGDDSATRWVIQEMDTDETLVQDVGVYNCLINAYSKQGDMSRALETLQAMEERKIKPNTSTYGSILEGYIRVGNVREALKLYELCAKKGGLAPDARMRKSLIYGCGLYDMSDIAKCIIADLQASGEEGAREARKLSFVLKAAAEVKQSNIEGRVGSAARKRRGPNPTRQRSKSPSMSSEISGLIDDMSSISCVPTAEDPCPVPENTVEWNRGLEMWKFWLGLPNNYYEAKAQQGIESAQRPSASTARRSKTDVSKPRYGDSGG